MIRKVCAGPLEFRVRMRYAGRATQGVSLEVRHAGRDNALVRLDAYDEHAHYHYDPQGRNDRILLDPTLVDAPRAWALETVRTRLAAMVARAGAPELAARLDRELPEGWFSQVRQAVEETDREGRRVVVHQQGEEMFRAGSLVFGLQPFALPPEPGIAVHVLAEVNGSLSEIVCFDCYDDVPHYHYSPSRKNIVMYLDRAAVGDPLEWSLEQMRAGRLPRMIERAGYPEVAAAVDDDEVARVLRDAVEPAARRMAAAAREAVRQPPANLPQRHPRWPEPPFALPLAAEGLSPARSATPSVLPNALGAGVHPAA